MPDPLPHPGPPDPVAVLACVTVQGLTCAIAGPVDELEALLATAPRGAVITVLARLGAN
jgi:hypothetical protein